MKRNPRLMRTLTFLFATGMVGGGLLAAVITEHDSTQPRGSPGGPNDQGQPTDPIIDGFRAPAIAAGQQGGDRHFRHSMGSIMSYSMRDPSFFATLNVANQDMIDYINSLPGEPDDPSTPLGSFIRDNRLSGDITRVGGRLEPEHLLPVTADFCLRCHGPVGWLEAHSEPASSAFPFLQGDFWGASFREQPLDTLGNPRPVDLTHESEAEMEGVQCDFCHRTSGAYKRASRFDGSLLTAGNGSFFVTRTNPFGALGLPRPNNDFQEDSSDMCGTCHDVTNPAFKTRTEVGGTVPDMLHPIERTYTEWYWSAYRTQPGKRKECKSCHVPMKFQGAQTWLLYPGMDLLWGNLDQKWVDQGYATNPGRTAALRAAATGNKAFMAKKAARVQLVGLPTQVAPGANLRVKVKVTNLTGHKLPTGFIEGRQMWIHIKAVDAAGNVVFEDGVLDAAGALVRTPETKVYEQETVADGYPFLGPETHFRFVLMNNIVKDNRIPPLGYNKAAYTADGAFIIPHDPKDTDYADGQNWDITPYSFAVPATATGPIQVTATLYYQTFSREYVEFLRDHDQERPRADGGRARDLPPGPYAIHETWGEVLHQLWEDTGKGPPVNMGSATASIGVP